MPEFPAIGEGSGDTGMKACMSLNFAKGHFDLSCLCLAWVNVVLFMALRNAPGSVALPF